MFCVMLCLPLVFHPTLAFGCFQLLLCGFCSRLFCCSHLAVGRGGLSNDIVCSYWCYCGVPQVEMNLPERLWCMVIGSQLVPPDPMVYHYVSLVAASKSLSFFKKRCSSSCTQTTSPKPSGLSWGGVGRSLKQSCLLGQWVDGKQPHSKSPKNS